MMECVQNFKAEVQELGDRFDHIEKKMDEFASSHNTLIDAHNDEKDELEKLKGKVADLEDCLRQNNVKLRGVPEFV